MRVRLPPAAVTQVHARHLRAAHHARRHAQLPAHHDRHRDRTGARAEHERTERLAYVDSKRRDAIVAQLTAAIESAGGTVLDARMNRVGTDYVGMLLV